MEFGSLLHAVGELECFDLPLLVQVFQQPRESIRVQLSRWVRQGKVVGLRRGMYALGTAYRRAALTAPRLSNLLYRPSYLSGLWALGFYDFIPEHVAWLTSVTTRVAKRFENPLGVFDYRNLRREAFFGYHSVEYAGREVLLAEPEKALLDHWHLAPGEWTPPRLAEMRYQNLERIDPDRLLAYAERLHSPRLARSARRLLRLFAEQEKGTRTL
ncbi:MAG: hypothetical protein BWX88_00821 [Planctomycetes bacterium ADurb.Bin126]|nr:MAG: hypothetical protein BWX88_00821 [Planctomycetes bacterium ADurb.Bin126]HOD80246.1 hypothetical protein [Phycisphaerae bacterium]